MNKDFDFLLSLFCNGALGVPITLTGSTEKIPVLAAKHNIYYSVLYSLKLSEPNDRCIETQHYHYLDELSAECALTYVKRQEFQRLAALLESRNINNAVLKGFSSAIEYAEPYSRVSGDVDILISPEDESKAIKALEDFGFVCTAERANGSNHIEFYCKSIGTLELHTLPHTQNFINLCLEKGLNEAMLFPQKPFVKLKDEDGELWILEIGDRINYLFFHIVKHFISTGLSIRAIMDFVLTYINHTDEFDSENFMNSLHKAKLDYFCYVIFAISEKYCPQIKNKLPHKIKVSSKDVDKLLEDLFIGGWFGYSLGAENLWAGKKLFQKSKKCNSSKKTSNEKGLIFPEISQLDEKYSYAIKIHFLLPIAWVHRFLFTIIKRPKKIKAYLNKKRRSRLFKKMNIAK